MIGAIGNDPESADLRYLIDRRVVAAIEDDAETVADAQNCFDLVVRELHRPRSGSLAMVQAQLTTILVILWRLSGVEGVAAARTRRSVADFAAVQATGRDALPRSVGAYAETIGISPDRLHDICRRKLAKTPSQLVQERVVHEARLRLERSALTVEQVANSLGFRDVGHFSRFFKSKAGLPPATYRDRVVLPVGDDHKVPRSSYADWP